jgi:hypothetical protein
MQEVQLYTHIVAQVFKVLQQILHNILTIWPLSQEVVHQFFEAVPCLLFKMSHRIFKEWLTHEFTNLTDGKTPAFSLSWVIVQNV